MIQAMTKALLAHAKSSTTLVHYSTVDVNYSFQIFNVIQSRTLIKQI